MSYPELRRFDFHKNGDSNRRDADALPRVLFVGFDLDHDYLHFHVAGDEYLRAAHILDAAQDHALIDGLEPYYALRLGKEYERVRAGVDGELT